MSTAVHMQDITRPEPQNLAPHIALPSNSILPHWVVRDTMTSATSVPHSGGFPFLHTFNSFFRALSAACVGLLLHFVKFIEISCSTFHNQETHWHACYQSVIPQGSPPRIEPIAALLGLRPRNGQVGEAVQRYAQLAIVEWRVVLPENVTNLRVESCKIHCRAEALGLIDRPSA